MARSGAFGPGSSEESSALSVLYGTMLHCVTALFIEATALFIEALPLPETCYMPCARRFAESHNTGTRQRNGHSAKSLFAECLEPNTRQTRGTRHNPYLPSAGAQQTKGTWQNIDMPSASERAHGKAGARARHARRPTRPFALPSASRLALGKMRFCRVSFPGTRQSPVLPKKNCGRRGNRARDLPHTKNPPLPSRRSLFSVQLGLRFLKLYI